MSNDEKKWKKAFPFQTITGIRALDAGREGGAEVAQSNDYLYYLPTPLAAAAFSGREGLFLGVYNTLKEHKEITCDEVGKHNTFSSRRSEEI